MELTTLFTALVLAIGVFHLVSQMTHHIRRYVVTTKSGNTSYATKTAERDDWYVFFHRCQLTGELRERMAPRDTSSTAPRRKKPHSPAGRRQQLRPVAR